MFSRKKIIRKIKQQQQDVRRLPWWITALIILAIIVLIVANGCITINVTVEDPSSEALEFLSQFPTSTPTSAFEPGGPRERIAQTVEAQHPDLDVMSLEITPTGIVEYFAPEGYPVRTAVWDVATAVSNNTDTEMIPLIVVNERGFGNDTAYAGRVPRGGSGPMLDINSTPVPTPDPLEPEIAAALDRYNYIVKYSIDLSDNGFILIGLDERFDIANTRTVITDQIIDITSDRFPDILITIVPVSVDD